MRVFRGSQHIASYPSLEEEKIRIIYIHRIDLLYEKKGINEEDNKILSLERMKACHGRNGGRRLLISMHVDTGQ